MERDAEYFEAHISIVDWENANPLSADHSHPWQSSTIWTLLWAFALIGVAFGGFRAVKILGQWSPKIKQLVKRRIWRIRYMFGEPSFAWKCTQVSTRPGAKGQMTDLEKKRIDQDLVVAARDGELEVVRVLLSYGANVNEMDKFNNESTALILASSRSHLHIVEILLYSGADVNAADNTGSTALIWAARGGHLLIVKALVANGANVNATDSDQWTGLIWAALRGHLQIAKVLLADGANPDIANDNGSTALILAAMRGHLHIVKELLAYGAYVNAINHKGKTALKAASSQGFQEVVEALIRRGADTNICETGRTYLISSEVRETGFHSRRNEKVPTAKGLF